MTPQEAYAILGVQEDISDEDLKKIYRDNAKKYHPDVNKNDPNKFKQINEAYQLIIDFRTNPNKYAPKTQQGFWNNINFNDIFQGIGGNPFGQVKQSVHHIIPIIIKIDVSFHESILGCQKEIKYNRSIKCNTCDGAGSKSIKNDCKNCNGFGQCTQQQRGMIFQVGCPKCKGQGIKQEQCNICKGKSTLDDQRSGNINIPAGSNNGDVLRMAGEGNFSGQSVFGDSYSDVNIHINVKSHPIMSLKNKDVYSEYKISLLEAFEGKILDIETVYGNKTITIKPGSRHSDQIKIPSCGVKDSNGMHIVQLNVEYPTNIDKLIEILRNE